MKYASIYKSYIHQSFSLPTPIIRYLAKYHTINKKLIQSFKWFFVKNPIFPLTCLHYNPYFDSRTCKSNKCNFGFENEINFEKTSIKILMADSLYIDSDVHFDLASSLIPKLYKCLVATLHLYLQNITFQEFLFLTPVVKNLCFYRVTIKYDNDGSIVPFKNLVEKLKMLEIFAYSFKEGAIEISTETVTNLVKMKHVKNLISISWHKISEKFNLELFSNFIKEHRKIRYCLEFERNVSDNFKRLSKRITKELIESTPEGLPVPIIWSI